VSSGSVRRTLHAATTAVAFLALVSPTALRFGTAYLAATALVLEVVRLRFPAVAGLLARIVPVYREHERRRPSGALWLMLGYAVCAWFPGPGAIAGVLAGGLADPAGAIVGTRYGRGAAKSGPGSAAVAGTTMVAAAAVGVPWTVALLAGLAAAAVERWPGPLDDNLLVGPVTAAVVSLLA
jgi:dolichol kinase